MQEAERCFSCGTCNLCLQCVSYCPDASIRPDGRKQPLRSTWTTAKDAASVLMNAPGG